ncbi:MAG: arginine--tRNA ligase [Candidatus Zixiibacteriota bacterium]|nr:MAG: arginine--tRNA ligase [candidate division Zixibacteria bacterium]
MKKDKYKQQFAEATAQAFRNVYPEIYAKVGDGDNAFSTEFIYNSLETPKDRSMGRFAFPVFRQAGLLKDKPPAIAAKVADETTRILKSHEGDQLISCSKAVGGFLNGQVNPEILAGETLRKVIGSSNQYGNSDIGKGKAYLVEYSSPNIAKPFGVMHLRSTVLGNSLRRIFRKLGYDVVGINYPGDWGTQFGKMIVAYEKWGDEKTLEGNAVQNLLALYVRYHQEVEQNPSLDDEARLAFRRLEEGNPDALRLWETFKKISHAEFDRVYGLLGVEFDWVYGESELNERMEPLIERLETAGLTSISQGALVVELGDDQLPPLLLRKGDGATLYATRDLAGMVYRWERHQDFHESLYVVNSAQSDHFKQCFKTMALLEEAEGVPLDERMSSRLKHVGFGMIRFGGKSMSTRGGNIVLLEDVISEASRLVREKIKEKNSDLAGIDQVAHEVGLGAVIFAQLSVRRQRDVDFDWDKVLNFLGASGPYLQYTHARLRSLLRKSGLEISSDVDYRLLVADEENRVIELIADFPQIVTDVAEQHEPYYIANYLLRLAEAFNSVYQRKDDEGNIQKIISDQADLTAVRIALVRAVQVVINEGLYLLGLEAPEEM